MPGGSRGGGVPLAPRPLFRTVRARNHEFFKKDDENALGVEGSLSDYQHKKHRHGDVTQTRREYVVFLKKAGYKYVWDT